MPDPKDNPLSLMAPLSDDEVDELQAFLISDAVSDETMLVDQLDGFLTAIVIGPTTIMPSRWLPRIWGSSLDDAPEFESAEQAQRIMTLIMRHMNGIAVSVGANPEDFDPMFVTGGYEGDPGEYLDGEMWCHGFMQGIELCRQDWRPMLDHPEGVRILRPIFLLGAEDVSAEEEKLTETPGQRHALSHEVPAAVAAIYRHWLPHRRAASAPSAKTPLRRGQKIGRNEPCPCGSGRKFKHCCGADGSVH